MFFRVRFDRTEQLVRIRFGSRSEKNSRVSLYDHEINYSGGSLWYFYATMIFINQNHGCIISHAQTFMNINFRSNLLTLPYVYTFIFSFSVIHIQFHSFLFIFVQLRLYLNYGNPSLRNGNFHPEKKGFF